MFENIKIFTTLYFKRHSLIGMWKRADIRDLKMYLQNYRDQNVYIRAKLPIKFPCSKGFYYWAFSLFFFVLQITAKYVIMIPKWPFY